MTDRAKIIAEWLSWFIDPDQWTELRALHFPDKKSRSAFFPGSQLDQMAIQALRWENAGARGVYFTPNPLREDVTDKLNAEDADVLFRKWILIDVDPKRDADTSSTDSERAAAWEVLKLCKSVMESVGFAGAVLGDSANGFHLCYPCTLPNDEASKEKIRNLLKGLSSELNNDQVLVDTTCSNASRIWKLYGTIARKGESTDERPHRYSQIIRKEPGPPSVATDNAALLLRLLNSFKMRSPKNHKPASEDDRAKKYAQAALESEVQRVLNAVAGDGENGRNNCLNKAAFAMGQLVGANAINRGEVENRLRDAALSVGLDEQKDISGTLRSGLEAGIKNPREMSALITASTSSATATASATVHVKPSQPLWLPPLPLVREIEPLPFPLNVFPSHVRNHVSAVADCLNCPVDLPAAFAIGISAGAIGNTRRVAIHSTHTQGAVVHIAGVARSGDGKSPALSEAIKPLIEFERSQRKIYKQEKRYYNDLTDEEKKHQPEPSRPQRSIVDDTTTERLMGLLQESPRGLIMVRDELSALIFGLNQYKAGGKGADRQHLLKLWAQSPIRVDRKNGDEFFIPHPTCSIVGCIPPSEVHAFRNSRNHAQGTDGMIERFLFAYPEPLPAVPEQWKSIPENLSAWWVETITLLLNLQMVPKDPGMTFTAEDKSDQEAFADNYAPYLLHLTDEAKEVWEEFTKEHASEVNDESFPEHLRPWWSKIKGYCPRLALIIHCLRSVCGELEGYHQDTDCRHNVDSISMDFGWQLVRYFKAHSRRMNQFMDGDPSISDARAVLKCIQGLKRENDLAFFSRRDIHQKLRRRFQPGQLDEPLKLLMEHRYIRILPDDTNRRSDFRFVHFELNPASKDAQLCLEENGESQS